MSLSWPKQSHYAATATAAAEAAAEAFLSLSKAPVSVGKATMLRSSDYCIQVLIRMKQKIVEEAKKQTEAMDDFFPELGSEK